MTRHQIPPALFRSAPDEDAAAPAPAPADSHAETMTRLRDPFTVQAPTPIAGPLGTTPAA